MLQTNEPYAFADLRGKAAIVTGGASGIGLSVANTLASHGVRVAVVDRDEGRVGSAVASMTSRGCDVVGHVVDVADANAVDEMVDSTVEAWGQLDILVTCAGIAEEVSILKVERSQWDRVLGVNLHGVFNCVRAAVRQMSRTTRSNTAQAANIVCISSVSAGGAPFQAPYSASKSGLHGLVGSIAREVGDLGIRANVVAPGHVRTPMTASTPAEVFAATSQLADLGRAAEPEEIAGVVLFLVSDLASYVTGQTISACGGFNVLGVFRPEASTASSGTGWSRGEGDF